MMSQSENPAKVPRTARDVLRCFLRNPLLTDTFEGVARWRVQELTIDQTVGRVREALDWLVDNGLLLKDEPSGKFRLNEQTAERARMLLDVSRPASPSAESAENVLVASLAWVDAVLLHHHRRNPADPGELPGLTRSHQAVEIALSPRSDGHRAATEAGEQTSLELFAAFIEALFAAPPSHPLAALFRRLDLTALELQALLLCLAPEIDAKYQTVFGVMNDDLSRRSPSLGLLSAVLGQPPAVRSLLGRAHGLLGWRLLEGGDHLPRADEPMRLDPFLVDWLLGDAAALFHDPRLASLVRPAVKSGEFRPRNQADADLLEELVGGLSSPTPETVVLVGQDVLEVAQLVENAADRLGRTLLRVRGGDLVGIGAAEMVEISARLARTVRLLDGILMLVVESPVPRVEELAAVERVLAALTASDNRAVAVAPDLGLFAGRLPAATIRAFTRTALDWPARSRLYLERAKAASIPLDRGEADHLAQAFPLSEQGICSAVQLATLEGIAQAPATERARALMSACRRIASPDLPRFARAIEPTFDLSDVVLPEDQRDQLREIVSHVLHATDVLHDWGFDSQLAYGRGIAALFCGSSGTGKTMAAQAIARQLGTQTFMVDLSRVVSKYIGESEKNLDIVFNDAERAGAVLLFDEADALFGKRSEIKDAHDRYANIEVAYLLQRMESFTGLAILTTNFRQNVDQAFLRRVRFVVEFPRPDAVAREAIWRRCLPSEAPVAPDLDLRLLARRLDLTGGNIRQITLRAAFAAKSEGGARIDMRHILAATRAELRKLGMPSAERDIAGLQTVVRPAAAMVV